MARGDADLSIQLLRKHYTDSQLYQLQENGRHLVQAAIASENPEALSAVMRHLPAFARPQFMYPVLDIGDLEMTRIFLAHDTDPSADGSEALRRVIRSKSGTLDMFRLLAHAGAVPKPCCMLYCVCPWTPIELITQGLLSGESIECTHEENPLFVEWLLGGECFAPYMRVVAKICPDFVNESNSHGWTPLMLAAGTLNQSNVECLLELNADVNVFDDAHHSALDWCIAAGAGVIPEWYSEAYYDQETPACYKYGDEERAHNAELIHDLLTAAVERTSVY